MNMNSKLKKISMVLCIILVGAIFSGCVEKKNTAPEAVIKTDKSEANIGETITFDGSNSSDIDGEIVKYLWTFGDGTNATGKVVTHSYSKSGVFSVTLNVTDDDGAHGTNSTKISVLSKDVKFIATPDRPYEKEKVTFDATVSVDSGNLTKFNWTFGDGETSTEGPKVTHVYSTKGEYIVVLEATYANGTIGRYEMIIVVYTTEGVNCADTFRWSTLEDPTSLDPARCYETSGVGIIQNCYETLIWYDRDSAERLVPVLATEVPTIENGGISSDGLNYTFHLRKGVKFHDGTEMTAEDVKYSIDRVLIMALDFGPSWILEQTLTYYVGVYYGETKGDWVRSENPPSYMVAAIPGGDDHEITEDDVRAICDLAVTIVDDYTVKFRLGHPYPAFIYCMASTVSSIVSKDYVEAHGGVVPREKNEHMDRHECGTGPYEVVEWLPEQTLTLERFEDYWGPKPRLKRAILYVDKEYVTRRDRLFAGEVDSAVIGWDHKGDVEGKPGLRIETDALTFTIMIIGLNQKIANVSGMTIPEDFFADIHVRKAFSYIWDHEEFINNVLNGSGIRATGAIPKGMFGYNETTGYTYDPTKAEEEFKAAGYWEKGFKFTLYYNSSNMIHKNGCLMLSDALKKLNPKFEVDVVALEWTTYHDKMRKGELPAFFIDWRPAYADPDNCAFPFLHSKGTFPSKCHFGDPELDELIERAAKELNVTTRKDLYKQIQELTHEHCPFIWIYQAKMFHVEKDWVVGWFDNPMHGSFYIAALMKGYSK
jgi:peptide/nickel transport system substrate-binding protein